MTTMHRKNEGGATTSGPTTLAKAIRATAALAPALTLALTIGLLLAPAASARNDVVEVTVEQAKQYDTRESIGPMPWYLKGESHPAVAESVGDMRTQKPTNAFGKADDHACGIAFQSAVIQLQKRAKELGGDAIVDIVSIAAGEGDKPQVYESATTFRCEAGNVVARVTLKGRAVKLSK